MALTGRAREGGYDEGVRNARGGNRCRPEEAFQTNHTNQKKRVSLMGKFSALALASLLAVLGASTTAAQAKMQVTKVSLTASPTNYKGKCPAVIHFKGTITTNGPGTVKYKFLRSDGAIALVKTLTFAAAGTKTV